MSDVNQMFNFLKPVLFLKFLLLVSIFINIYLKYNSDPLIMILLFTLTTIIIINNLIRNKKLKGNPKYEYISLLFSICAATLLQYLIGSLTTTFYMYSYLYDIFQLEKNILKFFISIHLLLYILVIGLDSDFSDIFHIISIAGVKIFAYLATTGMLYYQKNLEVEKEEIKKLNEKLKLANIKLQKYALEVEEMTISRERTKVAQELHDSLGHSLMALNMHLEFAKNICSTKPKKAEEVLAKSEKIAKGSINDLRKAVSLLSSELQITEFNTSLEKLISTFDLFNDIKITFNMNESIDDLSPLIKTSIYKTIQEAITNSLSHGNSTEITIKITRNSENIKLVVADNGIGCNNISKSNGLNGIEHRIKLLRGTTQYFSHNNLGFSIKVFIPI